MPARVAILAACTAMLLLPALPAAAQQAADTLATLQANGEGQVMVTPDIAIVTIGVVSRAASAGDALAANSTDLSAAIAAIRAAGVMDKDIGTSGFTIAPVYQQPPRTPTDQPLPIVGYNVENDVRVTIRDLSASGTILDQVVKAGANRVNGIAFDVSDEKGADDDATKAAVADALHRGQLMADAAGVKLGRVLSVTVSTGGGGPIPAFARADLAAAPAPPVLAGQRTVSASASISWEISGG